MVALSSILNGDSSKIGHVFPYFITPLLFILLPYLIMEAIGDDKFVHYLFLGAVISAIYVICHFVTLNILGVKLELFLPFIKEEGARFIFVERQRAFAPEPGVAAYYFATMGCLKIFLKKLKTNLDLFLQILIIIAMALSFSPQAFLMLIFIFIFSAGNREYRSYLLIFSFLIFGLIFYFIPAEILKIGFGILFNKLSLSPDSYSASDRLSRWILALSFTNDVTVFGYGAGAATTLFGSSFTSSFLTLLFEGGFLACLIFFTIFLRWPVKGKFPLIFPYLSGILFVSISSPYYIGYVFILRILLMRKD
ncbi:MAG: hypothetical protein VX693_06965 [Pseudomonadota bacterium]|nr:hypothetical protein [Pseudomonadota bacterium]